MAFMSLTGWAVDLDGSKFSISNVTYSKSVPLSEVAASGYTLHTDYEIDLDTWYIDEACTTVAKDGDGNPYAINTLPVGKYWVEITGAGAYEALKTSASFNVLAIAATISFNDGQYKEWNTADPASFEYTLKKEGAAWDKDAGTEALGLTVGRVAGEAKGEFAYTFDWTNKNYSLTRSDAYTFEIKAKNLSTTATITALKTSVVYSGKNVTGIYSVKDGETTLVEGTDWSMADTKNAGTGYTPLITFAGNYTGTKSPTTPFAITKAPITVSIDDIEVTYDGADHGDQTGEAAVKFSYSGIVGDDVATAATIKTGFTAPSEVKVATEAINAGTYTLALKEDAVGSLNYAITTYVPGTLTIKKAELKIKAKDASKVLGAADPEFELDALPALVAGHSVTGVTFTREKAGTTEGEEAGEYAITPNISAAKVIVTGSDPEVIVTSNYDLKVDDTKGKLSIGKGNIIVIVKDAEKAYGAADPEFTYKAVGLAEGDEDKLVVTITRAKAGTAEGEAVNSYAITATAANPDATKYSGVTIYDGVFTINKAKLTFVMPAQNIEKNTTETALVALKKNITVKGIKKEGEDEASLYDLTFGAGVTASGTPKKATADETVGGGLVATLTTAASKNYEIDAESDNFVSATVANGKLIVGTGTDNAIAFTSVDADYTTITTQAGETQDVTLKIDKRTREIPTGTAHSWAAQTWNAMVLPFEVSVAELSAQLGTTSKYAIVNRVDKDKTIEGNVMFKLEMGTIPANEPFCIKTTEAIPDGTITLTFNDKLIVAPGSEYPSVPAGCGYKFVGVYKGFTIDKTKSLFYFLRGDTPKWAHITSSSANTWDMVPFDAYIDQTGAASARELTFTFQELDGSYTAIRSIAADKNDEGAAKTGWYNLNGMKLQSAPAQKGVYIHNGKKVIIK